MDSLFDKISSIGALKTAWKHVLQKNSRGGLDSVQPLDIEQDIEKKLMAFSITLIKKKMITISKKLIL